MTARWPPDGGHRAVTARRGQAQQLTPVLSRVLSRVVSPAVSPVVSPVVSPAAQVSSHTEVGAPCGLAGSSSVLA